MSQNINHQKISDISKHMNLCHMTGLPDYDTPSTMMQYIYLGGVLFQHADGLGVEGRGLSLQVCDGAVSLDGQDGVGLGHVHCVLDVGGAAILQLHLLQAALVIRICSGTRRRMFKPNDETGLKSRMKTESCLLWEDGYFPICV